MSTKLGNLGMGKYDAQSDALTLKCTVTTLDAATLNALAATPAAITPAPPSGKVILFADALFSFDYAAAFVDGGGAFVIEYSGGNNASTSLTSNNIMDGSADAIRTIKQLTTDVTPVAGEALQITQTGSEFTGGAGSTVTITCFYYVVDDGLG